MFHIKTFVVHRKKDHEAWTFLSCGSTSWAAAGPFFDDVLRSNLRWCAANVLWNVCEADTGAECSKCWSPLPTQNCLLQLFTIALMVGISQHFLIDMCFLCRCIVVRVCYTVCCKNLGEFALFCLNLWWVILSFCWGSGSDAIFSISESDIVRWVFIKH